MSEWLVRVRAEKKEGLIVEIGRMVVESGFKSLAQRLGSPAPGEAQFEFDVSGPQDHLLLLQDKLGSNPNVKSVEVAVRTNGAAGKPAAAARTTPTVDIERQLPLIAAEYPQIFARLLTIERSVDGSARAETMQRIGQRVGAWVYKRDYALGGKLNKSDTIKRIVVPALRGLATIDQVGEQIHIRTSPFCGSKTTGEERCQFFVGFIEGMLREAGHGNVTVTESECRSTGAATCVFMAVG